MWIYILPLTLIDLIYPKAFRELDTLVPWSWYPKQRRLLHSRDETVWEEPIQTVYKATANQVRSIRQVVSDSMIRLSKREV